MDFIHNGVIMKFSSKKIMRKVKKRLYYDEDNMLPFKIIQNEERLLLSNLWFPCKIENNDELDEIKNFYRSKTYRNCYSSVCDCKIGSLWRLGIELATDYSQTRCSNPDCESKLHLPIIFE